MRSPVEIASAQSNHLSVTEVIDSLLVRRRARATRSNTYVMLLTILILLLLLTAVTGCDSKPKVDNSEDEVETVKLPPPMNMLVVGNKDFGEDVARQWTARRDGKIEVSHLSVDKFIAGDLAIDNETDLIVYPSKFLGELAINESVRPVPKNIWEDETFNKTGLLRHFRKSLVRHDNKVWGIPLGGQQLVLLYRKDVLSTLGSKPPTTWEELHAILGKIEASQDQTVSKFKNPILAPVGEGWAGELLLARVAASIRQRGKLSTVFNRQDMKPLITLEPFVLALNDLKSMTQSSDQQSSQNPASVYDAFANGKCVFAITWPDKSTKGESVAAESENWGVVPVPGSKMVFDVTDKDWRDRGKEFRPQVDTLGASGWIVSVPMNTRNYRDAFAFAAWMADQQMSQSLLSSLSGPFRAGHLGALDRWIGDPLDRNFIDEYADLIRDTHEETIVLIFPRVAARTKYLATLDAAVVKFLNDDGDAETILGELAEQWESITESEGKAGQVKQLRRAADL
jgi:ABC-type glycerol-3-phosphate transport system substrate-binding protein